MLRAPDPADGPNGAAKSTVRRTNILKPGATDSGGLRRPESERRQTDAGRRAADQDGSPGDRRRGEPADYGGVDRRQGDRRGGEAGGDRRKAMFDSGVRRAAPRPSESPRDSRELRDSRDDDPSRTSVIQGSAAPRPVGVNDTVLETGVPTRPIAILCKSCDRVTRKKSPYCEHCGRPLTNLEGTVMMSCKWSGGQTPAGERAIYALVTVRPSIRFLSSAPARNLGILIDMSTPDGRADAGHRLKMVRRILEHAIDELGPTDTLSVCFFGRRPYLFLTAERIEDKKAAKRLLQKKMESLDLGDGRFLGEAIEQVCREVRRNFSPDKVNRVIIITDGGCSDRDEALRACELEAEAGIGFSTITLGDGPYVEFLAQLSATGHGKCYPDVDYRHVPEILSQELMTVRATFTTQVELFIHVDPGWAVSRVFKISPVIVDLGRKYADERNFSIKMADLQLYDDQTLMFEISPVSVVSHRNTLALCEVVCDFPRDDVMNMSFSLPIQVHHPQSALLEENEEVLKQVRMIMAVFGQHGLGVK
jgi:hypothetical protein